MRGVGVSVAYKYFHNFPNMLLPGLLHLISSECDRISTPLTAYRLRLNRALKKIPTKRCWTEPLFNNNPILISDFFKGVQCPLLSTIGSLSTFI